MIERMSRDRSGAAVTPARTGVGWSQRALVFMFSCVLALFSAASAGAQAADNEWISPAPDTQAAPADDWADADGAADTADYEAAEPTEAAEPAEYTDQGAAPSADEYADTDAAALRDFRPYLDPHGVWLYDPVYGQIWVPNRAEVGDDFAPYVSNGYWGEDENGDWIWVSGYNFGWVTFHYGRWVYIPEVGWGWIPGRRYAPAWVVWRVPSDGSAYIGWAPMPPSWGWHSGVAVSLWFSPPYPYVFCPTAYVYHPHVHSYIIHDHRRVRYAAGHTRRYHSPRRAGRPHRGPSHAASGVPAGSRPKTRTPAKPLATQAARKSTSNKIRKAGYRAKALPGGSKRNLERAEAKGGRPLGARNLERSPAPGRKRSARPALAAQGSPRGANGRRTRLERSQTLGHAAGARPQPSAPRARADSGVAPRSGAAGTPRASSRRPAAGRRSGEAYRPRSTPRATPRATPRPAPQGSYNPKRGAPRPGYAPQRSYTPQRSYAPRRSSGGDSGDSASSKKKAGSSARSQSTKRSAPRYHAPRTAPRAPRASPRRSAPAGRSRR